MRTEKKAKCGDWVQIHQIVLTPEQRAPQVPEDTSRVPLEMKAKGELVEPEAFVGDEVSIRTAIGRTIKGRLIAVDPPCDISYGPTPPELRSVGSELRGILAGEVTKR